jgi:hypothetical protein
MSSLKEQLKLSALKWRILQEQFHKCAICGNILSLIDSELDHCHNTDLTRGVLCRNCNRGLGFFRDSVDLLHEAIIYLREYILSPRDIKYYTVRKNKIPQKILNLKSELLKLGINEITANAMVVAAEESLSVEKRAKLLEEKEIDRLYTADRKM